MRNTIAISSILLLLALAVACKKDESKKAASEPPAAQAPETDKVLAIIDAASAAATGAVAQATIAAASASSVSGTVTFTKFGETIKIEAKLTGLSPGSHGFHLHETGNCSAPDAKSAGGHFNPASVDHGAPEDKVHHSGDLGNIVANEKGEAELSVELPSSQLSLDADAANNIIGRAVIVHGGTDDLKSQPSGNAGPRVGCGVILIQNSQ